MKEKMNKVNLRKETDEAVNRMLEVVNVGFSSGKVTKTDLINWVLTKCEQEFIARWIEEIRKDHFDQLRHMEKLLKDMKKKQKEGEKIPKFEIQFSD